MPSSRQARYTPPASHTVNTRRHNDDDLLGMDDDWESFHLRCSRGMLLEIVPYVMSFKLGLVSASVSISISGHIESGPGPGVDGDVWVVRNE